jgi:hypothetical protein
MFEKTRRLAEQVASSVSRRGFLGSLGGWAATAALGVAGVLATVGTARANPRLHRCCYYGGGGTAPIFYICVPDGQTCPAFCGDLIYDSNYDGVKKCADCEYHGPSGNIPRPC